MSTTPTPAIEKGFYLTADKRSNELVLDSILQDAMNEERMWKYLQSVKTTSVWRTIFLVSAGWLVCIGLLIWHLL